MTKDVLIALVGVIGLVVAALVRVVYRLGERVSRLEGRMNGDRR